MTATDPLVTTEWLAENLGKPGVKVLDATSKLPDDRIETLRAVLTREYSAFVHGADTRGLAVTMTGADPTAAREGLRHKSVTT